MAKFGDVPVNGLEDCFIMWKLSQLKKVKKDHSPLFMPGKMQTGVCNASYWGYHMNFNQSQGS